VNKAVLTVKANDASMTYGGTLPTFTATYSGFANNETASVLTGSPSFTPTTAPTAAGTSAITPAQGTLTAANYTFTFVEGTLTVNKAVLTVKANDASMTYGGTLPTFTATYSGFANNESASVLTGSPSFTPTTAPTAAGTSAITPAQGTLTAANYTFTFVEGTLTVNKAVLTVKANDQSKIYGAALPEFTGTLTGVVNGDGITATYGTGATTASPVGTYPITVNLNDPNSKLSNYDVTSTNGTLTITARPVTVTADAKEKVYGAADPALTYQITNGSLASGDAFSGALVRDAGENVGAYAIKQGTLALSNNYNLTFAGASMTISKASLTVKAGDSSRLYGAANPTFTGTITGIQNGDNITATYTSLANAASAVGTYPIVPALSDAGNKLGNYIVTISNGTLTVTAASLTITPAGNKSKVLGSTFTAFTGTVSGLQNSDAVTVSYTSAGAPASAAVGTYDITVASVTFTQGSASNYNIVSNTASKGLTVSYGVCLLYDASRAVNSGATYPVKFYLCSASGSDVSSPGVIVNATDIFLIGGSTGTVEDAGNANPDSNFRYDATLGPSGGYIFNLKTSGLRTGTYSLTFTAAGASSSSYSAGFGVK
jgi:lipopolysaccharide export system protein LptA